MEKMSKAEAKASVEEMGRMMDYFDAPCEKCGRPNKDCECLADIEDEAYLRTISNTGVVIDNPR
jgi:hypothetical protein